MKYAFLLLSLTLVFCSACKNDDDNTGDNVLNYDGSNNAAPTLEFGIYEAAVRFPASTTSNFVGRQLVEVEFFLGSVPASTQIGVWGPGTANVPGALIYEADVSNNVSVGTWNSHVLNTPVDITADDIWVSVYVDHPAAIASIGCDSGPAKTNGDFIFDYSESTWYTFRDYTSGQSDINWNIRAILNE